ncbi:hypothetical protein CRG98_008247 [Punica granatum]|uniref:Isopenicillin N synthase-like Fe(2+) 2OG dioxygenase domain-containing protein n=1 Tax=Punica granatum TaxID=22663 RepID=A0A2I0KSD3_PUNGR|nr:hypothetical protein CRG98_008247 [Punica granatum]
MERLKRFCFHEVSFTDRDGPLRTSGVPVVQELSRRGVTCLPESALTLLFQLDAGTGGLQVLTRQGPQSLRTVEWPKGALLVSAGDLLEIMTDGKVKNPCHRALIHCNVECISIALFYDPPLDAEIVPLKGATGRYRRVVVDDYLRHVYKISPTKN